MDMLKRLKNNLIYFLVGILRGLFRILGWNLSLRFGRRLGQVAFWMARGERRKVVKHLQLAFPELSPEERIRLGRDVFGHFGKAVAECINLDKLSNPASYMILDAESKDVLDSALSAQKGVVYVSGHLGNWELMAQVLGRSGYPIYTIGKKSYDSRFTRLISDFREKGRVRTVWRGDPQVVEKMKEVLRCQAVMGLLIDQDTKVPGVFVPFFGLPAYTPNAAALLARVMSSPMVLGVNFRKPEGGYQIKIEKFETCNLPNTEEAVLEDTKRLTSRIETYIRAHPKEWVWMHQRWKTERPEH